MYVHISFDTCISTVTFVFTCMDNWSLVKAPFCDGISYYTHRSHVRTYIRFHCTHASPLLLLFACVWITALLWKHHPDISKQSIHCWLSTTHVIPSPPPPPTSLPRLLLCHCSASFDFPPSSHCAYTAQITPSHILQKLTQMCLTLSTNVGCVVWPKDCNEVVLFHKDLNLPKPDKWGTNQLPSFIQQVQSGGGRAVHTWLYHVCYHV